MLDVAIIGGGVCGLALAHSLHARRTDWRLFEARDRLGGRVLTRHAANGTPLDLGPTWFWPAHQPSIARLVSDLGLGTFAQTDDGRLLHLDDPQAPAQTKRVGLNEHGQLVLGPDDADNPTSLAPAANTVDGASNLGSVHGGALCVQGGMGAVVQALAAPLPPSRIQLGAVLHAVVDHGDHVALHGLQDGVPFCVQARRVVLALPPRLAYARLRFEPALPDELAATLRDTPTWMATAAKTGLAFDRPFWHDAGHTGNAWVTHPQAVLAEVFDASPPGQGGALAGFHALGASVRPQFSAAGMDLLLHSQVAQLFGPQAQDGELHTQDWACEPHTCSPLDLTDDGAPTVHPSYGAPLLAEPHWQGRLLFGGSETARQGGGYVEGALSAAARLRRELLAPHAAAPTPARARA